MPAASDPESGKRGLTFRLLLSKTAPRLLSLLFLPFQWCPFGFPNEDFADCSWRTREGNKQESQSLFISGAACLFLVWMEKKTKVHRALERKTNGRRTNAVKGNAKVVIPRQHFGWVSSSEKHWGGSRRDLVQEAGGLLYQEPCVMVRELHCVLGQATADGLQFTLLKDIFHVMCGKEQ